MVRPHVSAWPLATLAIVVVLSHGLAGDRRLAQPAPDVSRPGRLVDIGGRRLHLHCIGSGAPTVIFESSFGQFALDWWLTQPEVAKTTRACAYDRAGLGWSDPGPQVEHPEQIVSDLHALLAASGEHPPFVFVTMSMGAFYARAYQWAYPTDVAGFVFVEPTHEDAFLLPIDGKPTPLWAASAAQAATFVRSLTDAPKPPPPPLSTGAPFTRLPAEVLRRRLAFERQVIDAGATLAIEREIAALESRRVTAARLHDAGRALAALPLVVLTADQKRPPAVADAHANTAALSTHSRQRFVSGAHMLHLDQPAIVAAAVTDVVVAVRSGRSLPP